MTVKIGEDKHTVKAAKDLVAQDRRECRRRHGQGPAVRFCGGKRRPPEIAGMAPPPVPDLLFEAPPPLADGARDPGHNQFPLLLSPFAIGPVELRNRFVFQPHFTALGDLDGMASDAMSPITRSGRAAALG